MNNKKNNKHFMIQDRRLPVLKYNEIMFFVMKTNPYPGIFIALEGIDRCGKHTQGEMLKAYLDSIGFDALFTQEPWWGDFNAEDKKLKFIIKRQERADALEIQELFIMNRKRHLEKEIIPHIKSGVRNAVLCERYFLSTLAYGRATGAGTFYQLRKAHENMINFILPDVFFLIDISPGEAMHRLNKTADFFEEFNILETVRHNYLSLARMPDNGKTIRINGERKPEEVFLSIKQHIDNLIYEKNR